MSSSDPVPDVAPDAVPDAAPPAPTSSSPIVPGFNWFVPFFLGTSGLLVLYRFAWEGVSTLTGGKLPGFVFWLWMVPILGIIGSIIVPSVGATTSWVILMLSVSGVPILLSAVYVLLFGIQTSPKVLES